MATTLSADSDKLATSLSARVRELTTEDHRNAETAPFMTELMSGKRSSTDYALLVCQYAPIYEAPDSAVADMRESTDDAALKSLFDPALDRRAMLELDLQNLLPLLGENENNSEKFVANATKDYVRKIKEAADSPHLLVAHHYLRYLGDLSGGLAIATLVRRHYGLEHDSLNMYQFADIPKPKVYKDGYRQCLDQLNFTPEQQEAFIEEARQGFAHNRNVFIELAEMSANLEK